MLSHLVSLARPIELGGTAALGLAIYSDHTGEHLHARETGIEGVACVDDVSRALVLWCDLWERTREPVAREWVDGLLAFCRWMQLDDGRFANFILDWSGVRNVEGLTSRPDGASFWHARGARAMAKVWRTFGDERARADYERASASFDERPVAADVLAVQVLAALDAGDRGPDIARWCDGIAAQRRGDILVDAHDATEPHLWGHIQEGVLALAAPLVGRPDLLALARHSADAYLAPLIDGGFDLPMVQPYGAASAAFVMDTLAAATADARYGRAAQDARAWFDGRNPSGLPVYDRAAGRVADGVDGLALNAHAGAESQIAGAEAFIDEAASWLARNAARAAPGRQTAAILAG